MSVNTLTVRQYARPIRIAFLVDKNTWKEAVEFNTAIWGGERNPIVTVKVRSSKAEKEKALSILRSFAPEVIVNLTGKKIPYVEKEYPNKTLSKKIYTRAEFIGREKPNSKLKLKLGVSIRPILNELWDEGKISAESSNMLQFENNEHPEWNDMLLTMFGRYPTTGPLALNSDYNTVCKPKFVKITDQKSLDDSGAMFRGTPINLSSYDIELQNLGWSSISSHVMFVGHHDNWEDLVDFWNLRAAGKEIIFVPVNDYKNFKKSIERMIKAGDYAINDSVQNQVDVIPAFNATKAEIDQFVDWVSEEVGTNLPRRYFPVDWDERPKIMSSDVSVAKLTSSEKEEIISFEDEKSIQFFLNPPKFLADVRGMREKAWANIVEFSGYYGEDYTFSFPLNKNVEKLIKRSTMDFDDTLLSKEGLIVMSGYARKRLFFNPVKPFEVVEALFKSVGFEVKQSQPGRVTQNIIEFLGGLHSCRFLKIDGIRHALKAVNKKSYDASNLTSVIGQNWHTEDDDSMILIGGQDPRKLNPATAFQALLNSKLIRPGIDFNCTRCGQKAWYSVKEFGEQFTCTYCFLEQDVPRLDKKNWSYTSNGLIRIQDQGFGSIPVIISLWRFDHLRSLRGSQGLTSLELKSSDFECEIDYVFLVTNSDGSYDWVIGEAKGYEDITPAVVSKMKKVADRFENKPYISISTLKDELSEPEKKRLQKLVDKGYKVIILTRRELEPYDLYDRFEGLRNKYATQLSDLADNTQQLNLN